MAKQTFTTGSVLTAAQMNNLQANDYNWSVDSKSASYVLVAADAGKRIEMNAAGSTTITVNTGLFTAGDMVYISNIGAGTCTVTAGTATVNKATNASLALAQYQSGMLYFVSASSAIFYPFDIGSAVGAPNFSLLGTGTTTSGSTVTVSSLNGYSTIYVFFNGISSNQSTNLDLRINSDTASNYFRCGFYGAFGNGSNAYDVPQAYALASGTSILLGIGSGNQDQTFSGYLRLEGCNSAGVKTWSQLTAGPRGSGTATAYVFGTAGYYNSSSVVSSISVIASAGTFDAGTFAIYGSA